MNRFDRIMAVFLLLQTRKVVRAGDLADRFQVSIRTVYRDIRSLEEAGVPIAAEVGVGYSLVKGFQLPPVMFSKKEAESILWAELLMDRFGEVSIKNDFASAANRIRALLSEDERIALEELTNRMSFSRKYAPSQPITVPPEVMECVNKAIRESKQLFLSYRNIRNEITDRKVDALGIHFRHNYWYLIGWCHLRQDFRTFRLDRIVQSKLTTATFADHAVRLERFYKSLKVESPLQKIILDLTPDFAHKIAHEKYFHGWSHEKQLGDRIQMSFMVENLDSFTHWIIFYLKEIKVIEPKSLKEKIRYHALRISKNIERL